MTLPRRGFLHLAGAGAALAALSPAAAAQTYPTRPVRLIVGFPAGGPNDILARLVSHWLSERLGQPFVVENRPGGSGNVATETVVRAPADGYTLLLVGPANAISASLYDNLSFNFLRDIAPVAGITREPLVMLVHPSVPARTVPELVAYAKADPRRIKLASTGNGSSPHVSGELFKMLTAVDVAVVHYAGGGAGAESHGRRAGADDVRADVGGDRAHQDRPAAPTGGDHRHALGGAAGRPALADSVPGYEASAATGIGAPKDTPAEIIDTLNAAINAAFADAAMRARLAETGGVVLAGSPAEFGRVLVEETEKWAKVVKFSGAKPN